ncbi:hypothetical protein AB5J72_37750 [Streptomyces sp. CG1]|uniref:hypothetical protein n=1 Tax=Streptomyces sp. CG1 TaxID=1287523 RepID=UPI0034E2BC36
MPPAHAPTRRRTPSRNAALAVLCATAVASQLPLAGAAAAAPLPGVPSGYSAHLFAAAPTGQTGPDDIARLGDHLFAAYQNGVGSDGKPSPSGATKSTVFEYALSGQKIASWSLTGKVDGLGADPAGDRVVATVNEDANSSAFTISPSRPASEQVRHYAFTGLTHGGGTDSIVYAGGLLYATASAPQADADGKTYSQTALYTVKFTGGAAGTQGAAALTPVLKDNATAVDRVTGKPAKLNLSDPDSSEHIPAAVPGVGGEVLLDSQGDKQLVFLGAAKAPTVLNLNTQVDDSAFATRTTGTLYVVDGKANQILAVTGPFKKGQSFVSVPNDSDTLKGVLGSLNLKTGQVSTFAQLKNPKGLLFTDESYQGPTGQPTPGPSSTPTAGGTGGGTGSAGTPSAGASPSGSALAASGAGNTLGIVGIAGALLAAGSAVFYVTRRRSSRPSA